MTPLTAQQAAAIDTPHVVAGVDAAGAWLGYVPAVQASAIAAGPPPAAGTWRWQGAAWVRLYSLAEIKALKLQEIAQAWQAEFRGGMDVGQFRVPTDAEAISEYLILRQMAADGDWTNTSIELADGTEQTITQTQAQALWAALKTHRRTLRSKRRDKAALVLAAANPAAVAAITWTSTP